MHDDVTVCKYVETKALTADGSVDVGSIVIVFLEGKRKFFFYINE